jgi:putative membrane protein
MPHAPAPQDASRAAPLRGGSLVARSVAGGAFMGLANLVPGISGGTMLLAVGVYPQFIGAVAEVTTFRFSPPVLLLLACVGAGAGGAIAGGAGVIGTLLDHYPSAMYSLFIGLTLGGVPILWRMVQPLDPSVIGSAAGAVARMVQPLDPSVIGSAAGAVALMVLLAATDPARADGGASSDAAAYAMLAIAGFSGGAAMILPGVSGAYLLLVLGQYRPIVDAVASAAAAARAGDATAAAASLHVLLPVAVGVGLGVVCVSNLVKLLLARDRRTTLGFLLGLLLGSVVGLWPFAGVPSPAQAGAGAALVLTGFAISWTISRLGRDA